MKQPWWKNSRGEWYVVVQILLFALILLGPRLFDIKIDLPGSLETIMRVIGLVFILIGLSLAAIGILQLGSHLSPFPRPVEGSHLVQNGAYGLVRHPIYSGAILAALGWSLLIASLMSLVYTVILLAFFDIKSRREEIWLSEQFADYPAYQKRVRKLIPFVY